MRSIASILALSAMLSFACGDDEPDIVEGPFLAAGTGVESIYLYQVTEVPLLQGGQIVTTRDVPILQNRDTHLRVAVRAIESTEARSVVARLVIGSISATGDPTTIETELELTPGGATEFSFTVPGELITADATISIGVWELDDVQAAGDTSVARWPKDLDFPLDARDPGVFRLKLIPIDPSSAMGGNPIEFTPELLAEIESDLLAQMPVSSVELTVSDPLVWTEDLGEMRSWNSLLVALAALREQDDAADDVLYYGIIPFSLNLALGGMAATLANTPFWRVSTGVRGTRSNVLLHEITHVLGRNHSPCGNPGGPDPYYPYEDALLGNTGFDYTTGEFINAAVTYDVMSYCTPVWTSDYTYTALFRSIRQMNTVARSSSARTPQKPELSSDSVVACDLHALSSRAVGGAR